MQSVIIDISSIRQSAGESFERTGVLPETSYVSGTRELALEDGIHYDLVITNTGEGILVTGLARAAVNASCDRCLDDAHFDIAGEVEGYYLFDQPEGEIDQEEDEYQMVIDNTIDLADPLQAALVIETPYVILCDEDCAGLCPHCGINLNHEQCSCADNVISETHPFAKLAHLKLDAE